MKYRNFLFYLLFVMLISGCSSINKSTPTLEIPIQSNDGVTAEAKIIPIQSASLSFSGTGKIEAILAPEGSTVKKGTLIARLEGIERAQASIAAAEYLVVSAQKNLADLYEKANLAAADAELTLAKANLDLKDSLEKRDDLNYKRVNKYMLEGIQSQLIIAQNAVDDAETTFSYVEDKAEDDLDRARALAFLSQTRLYRDQIQRNFEYASGPADPKDIAKADAEVARAQALVEDAQRTYDRRKSGPDKKDIDLAEASLKNAESQADAARSILADLELVAPFDGIIVSNGLKVGEVVSSTTIVTIGDLSAWQVETTDLKEVDIIGIEAGQQVRIGLDAIPGIELTGVVDRIKAFGVDVRGDNTYIVYINLTNPDPRLLWNMTANVTFPLSRK